MMDMMDVVVALLFVAVCLFAIVQQGRAVRKLIAAESEAQRLRDRCRRREVETGTILIAGVGTISPIGSEWTMTHGETYRIDSVEIEPLRYGVDRFDVRLVPTRPKEA